MSLHIDLSNENMYENNKRKLLWIYWCFFMKTINIHEHHSYEKNNAGYVNVGIFPQQICFHCKLRKCVGEKLCGNVQNLLIKQPIILSKRNTIEKKIFWLPLVMFFTKSDLYNKAFKVRFFQIIRIWELFFRWVGSCISFKFSCLQQKTALSLSRN